MLQIREGERLERAFVLYECSYCGYVGIQATSAVAKPYRHPDYESGNIKYPIDIYEKPKFSVLSNMSLYHCPCCGLGLSSNEFNTEEEYVNALLDVEVTVEYLDKRNDKTKTEPYKLTQLDLYLKK